MSEEKSRVLDEMILQDTVDYSLLRFLRDAPPNDVNLLQLAMGLSKSNALDDKKEAIEIFRRLVKTPTFMRDAFYGLALTYYMLSEFEMALQYCEELLRQNPDHYQYNDLHQAILYKHKRKQKIDDTAAVMGVAVGVGLLASAALLFLRPSSKK